MKEDFIQLFISRNSENFDSIDLVEIQNKLHYLDDSKFTLLMNLNFRQPMLIIILAVVTGLDRFFLDDIGLGVLKILTCGGCGIWWLIDIFTAKKRTSDFNKKKLYEFLALVG